MKRTPLTQSTFLKLALNDAQRPLGAEAEGSEALALLRRIASGQS